MPRSSPARRCCSAPSRGTCAAQADLTQVQFEILMNLSNTGDSGLRMAQLADALIVSRSGLSYQVAQLESRGWITRERSSDDERGVVARITPDGERMRQRVYAGHIDIVRSAFLDAVEPGELTTLTAALERVAGRLRDDSTAQLNVEAAVAGVGDLGDLLAVLRRAAVVDEVADRCPSRGPRRWSCSR